MHEKNRGNGFDIPNLQQSQTPRSYKCPECGGEFNTWKRYRPAGKPSYDGCPFCGKKQGEYQ